MKKTGKKYLIDTNIIVDLFGNDEGIEGYMYIYVSNESLGSVEAFFDDISVEHIESKVTQVADYYPFGMQIKQTSTDVSNPLANKYLYNGKELQTELGLDWYDYGSRSCHVYP
jgi:hypothetical protein